MPKGTLLLLAALLLGGAPWVIAHPVSDFSNLYGVVNVGYGKVDTAYEGQSDVSFSAALAYQFHRQWYAEGGYVVQMDKHTETDSLSSKGPYFALLGKAGNEQGELYYKVGIAYLDVQQSFFEGEQPSCEGDGTNCEYQEQLFAGLVGLGFDYYLSKRVQLRMEYTYFAAKNDFSAHLTNVGVRYNF